MKGHWIAVFGSGMCIGFLFGSCAVSSYEASNHSACLDLELDLKSLSDSEDIRRITIKNKCFIRYGDELLTKDQAEVKLQELFKGLK